MANYYESARSNYFRVQDYAAFVDEVAKIGGGIEIYESNEGLCLLATEDSWPSCYEDENGGMVDVDYFTTIAKHLVDNSIIVFMGAGAEKLRYISGYAVAMNNKGETVQIVLDDIYKEAQEVFGDEAEITLAQY